MRGNGCWWRGCLCLWGCRVCSRCTGCLLSALKIRARCWAVVGGHFGGRRCAGVRSMGLGLLAVLSAGFTIALAAVSTVAVA